MYVISTSAIEPSPSDIMDAYDTVVSAQQDAVKFATNDSAGATYHVYEVTWKPVFKARATRTVATEVIP